jgi:hypothetical protein
MEVLGELDVEFWRLEEWRSQLEWSRARICDLLLGLLPGQVCLADHLDEATRQLGEELAAQQEVDTELEVLLTSAAQVKNLVLDNANGSSSMAASLSMVAELLEDWVDATATNDVH